MMKIIFPPTSHHTHPGQWFFLDCRLLGLASFLWHCNRLFSKLGGRNGSRCNRRSAFFTVDGHVGRDYA